MQFNMLRHGTCLNSIQQLKGRKKHAQNALFKLPEVQRNVSIYFNQIETEARGFLPSATNGSLSDLFSAWLWHQYSITQAEIYITVLLVLSLLNTD